MDTASGSVCASTGASPAITAITAGQSAPNPQRPAAELVAKEATTDLLYVLSYNAVVV
jgi:hypothetical protein